MFYTPPGKRSRLSSSASSGILYASHLNIENARLLGYTFSVFSTVAKDVVLLKGNAPSAAEWRHAWSVPSETMSLRKVARLYQKQTGGVVPIENRKRKRNRLQLRVMAEVLRNRTRRVLREATSITLALDESKYRKVVRYRADLPSRMSSGPGSLWRHVGASGFTHSGVLGIISCSKEHASDFDEDHAVIAVRHLNSFLEEFCTPLGRKRKTRGPQPLACDHDLKAHVMKTVTCISADGGSKERRAVFLAARELFSNLLIVIRDPAHAIRIASKALHCDDVFGDVWDALFHGKHALAPDIMNSDKWHNLFLAIQKDNLRIVARPGLPQALPGVIRNLGFAKQRFDSTAGPVGKIALMLLPVATLLAYIASDRRHEREQRERATALLKKLDTKFCAAIGASADWGIICNCFLRLFDVANHDIAKSRAQIDCMIETLEAVFVNGSVFQRLFEPASGGMNSVASGAAVEEPLPGVHPAVSAGGVEIGFISATVVRNLRKQFVFCAGGMPVLLCG